VSVAVETPPHRNKTRVQREIIRALPATELESRVDTVLEAGLLLNGFQVSRGDSGAQYSAYLVKFECKGLVYASSLSTFLPRTRFAGPPSEASTV